MMKQGVCFKVLVAMMVLICGRAPASEKNIENAAKMPFEIIDVFVAGRTKIAQVPDAVERYGQYREPGIVQTNSGRLVVVTQARDHSKWPDRSGQDLVVRWSDDDGKTWGPVQMAASHGNYSICPNVVVYDSQTDQLHVLYNLFLWDYTIGSKGRKALKANGKLDKECEQYHIFSNDGGKTWSKPRNITEMLGNEVGAIYVFGSGRGVQLKHGEHQGRLVIPGGARRPKWGNQIFYSDDHGKTWKLGKQADKTSEAKKMNVRNECKVAEMLDGTLVMNCRSMPFRTRAFSDNGGSTWSAIESDEGLPTASINGSLVNHVDPKTKKEYLVFGAPAGPGRVNGFVFVSEDGGKTWPHRRLMLPTTVAYSSLCSMANGEIAMAFENEVYKHGSYRHIKMIKFRISDVLGYMDDLPTDRKDKNEGTYQNPN